MSESENGFRGGALPPRVGERLSAARQAQGLSIEEISARTRVPARHLVAIEEGDNDALPAAPYATGFVKTYAKVLGLDGAELGRDFRAELGNARGVRDYTAPFEPADPKRVPSRALALVALVVAAVLAAAYLFWRIGGYGPDERATLAAGTGPVPASATAKAGGVPPRPSVPPPATGPVAVTAKEAVWVKIYERGGPTLFMGEMTPGQRIEVPATAADPLIWTGRPQAIGVSVGAQPIPPLGTADRRIKDVSLKREALLALATPPPAPPLPTPPVAENAAAAPLTPVDPTPPPTPAPPPAP